MDKRWVLDGGWKGTYELWDGVRSTVANLDGVSVKAKNLDWGGLMPASR